MTRWRLALTGFMLALPLLLLVSLAVLSHTSVTAVDRTHQAENQFEETRGHARQLLLAMLDNETGQRGFILSENSMFLDPYNASLESIPKLRQELSAELTAPESAEFFQRLEMAIEARLAFSARTVAMQQAGQHDASVALVATGEGKLLMDKVRAEEAALETLLNTRRQHSMAEYARLAAWHEKVSWLIVALDGLLAAALVVFVINVRRSRQLLQMCAWSKTLQYQGEWISFETYLYRRFGISVSHGINPAEAEKLLVKMREMEHEQAA